MPAPGSATYSAAAKVAANTAFRDLLDVGSGTASVKLYTSADALLATIPMNDPCGSINGSTGVLTFSFPGTPPNASASGTVAYATFNDVAGAVQLSLPAQAGSTSVSGFIVLNTLTLVSGSPVSIVSAAVT